MSTDAETGRSPLCVLHVLAPAVSGGLEEVVRMLSIAQRAAGYDVHVAASGVGMSAPHPLLNALEAAAVSVERNALSARAYAGERAWMRALCRRIAPDLVHTHGLRADVLHAPVARGLLIPAVSTVHGITIGSGLKDRFYHQLEWRALRRVNAVVAVSQPLVNRLAAVGIARERIAVIPNAYAPPARVFTREEARAKLGIPLGAFVVGWAGRLRREKGADVIVDALADLSDASIQLSMLGDGPERSALETQAARRGVRQRVHWHGLVPGAGAVMSAFDVFALSSRTEGTPIALLEALDAGIPVVATAVGGVPNMLSAGEGYIVEPESPRALAVALRAVFADRREAARRAAAGQARVRSQFAVKPWLDRYDALYRGIVACRRDARSAEASIFAASVPDGDVRMRARMTQP